MGRRGEGSRLGLGAQRELAGAKAVLLGHRGLRPVRDVVEELTREADWIVHFAAESHVDRSTTEDSRDGENR